MVKRHWKMMDFLGNPAHTGQIRGQLKRLWRLSGVECQGMAAILFRYAIATIFMFVIF
jgi:hypothetical protein